MSRLYNASHWQYRAEETRTIAERMSNVEAKSKLLKLAKDYDLMAEQTEQAEQLKPSIRPKSSNSGYWSGAAPELASIPTRPIAFLFVVGMD